ncbi:MAG: hypothetical protein ACKOB0_12535, partial [Chthoniobacterales bacterium]
MPEESPSLDLSALDFRPAWAKEPSAAPVAPREPREDDRAPRHDRGERKPPRPGGFKRGGPPRKGGFRGPKDRPKFDGSRRDERPAPPPNPFPWLRIAFTATPPAVETVVKQVRQTGKTYSLFDIARILLRNPASYTLDLTSAPKQEEGPFHVTEDGSVWLSRENAARHLLRTRLDDFYRAETVDVEAPKGNFTSIGVCGMSGTLLGPTNLHDFERRLRELHRERFSRLDFETFRSRVKMERDPEVIEKWRAAASKATHYFPKEGENPEKLESMSAVEQHFLDHHAAAQIRLEQIAKVPGDPKHARVDAALAPLLNYAKDEGRFVCALVETEAGFVQSAAETLGQAERETRFFVFGVVEQRGKGGVDAGILRIARNFGHWLETDLRGSVMVEKVLLDRAHAFQLLRILAFFGKVVRGFRCGGAPFFDHFRVAFHFHARTEGFEIEPRKTFAMQFAQAALEVVQVGRSEQ